MTPKKISIKDKRYLYIKWPDDSESMIALSNLRKNCPCAACMAERKNQPASYIPLLSSVQLTLEDIKAIGSYAVQLFWQDGHNTGIYTYEKLKKWQEQFKNISG
jgi:DUF971 family protein